TTIVPVVAASVRIAIVAIVAAVVPVVAEPEALVAAPLPAEHRVTLPAPAERRPVATVPLFDPSALAIPVALRVGLGGHHRHRQARCQREHHHLLHTTSRLLSSVTPWPWWSQCL